MIFFNSVVSVGGGHFADTPWLHMNLTKRLITKINQLIFFSAVFLNRRAAARYRALASIIQGREIFSRNLSF